MDIGHLLQLERHSRHNVHDERGRAGDELHRAGLADVAEGARTDGGSGENREMVRPGPRRGKRADGYRGRVLQVAGRGRFQGRHDRVVLVHFPGPHRVEADVDHDVVLVLAAVGRRVRAALLFGQRAPRLQHPVGQRHHIRVLRRGPCGRRHCVQSALPAQTQDAHGRVRRGRRRVAGHSHSLHESVRRRRKPAAGLRPDRRVRHVRVLQPVGHPPVAVDTVRRSVPDGCQRYVTNTAIETRPHRIASFGPRVRQNKRRRRPADDFSEKPIKLSIFPIRLSGILKMKVYYLFFHAFYYYQRN